MQEKLDKLLEKYRIASNNQHRLEIIPVSYIHDESEIIRKAVADLKKENPFINRYTGDFNWEYNENRSKKNPFLDKIKSLTNRIKKLIING